MTMSLDFTEGSPEQIFPGAIYLPGFLSLDEQVALARRCDELGRAEAGFYTPTLAGGLKMSIEIVSLGLHWDARRYAYALTRTDVDRLPVAPVPADLAEIASRLASQSGMTIIPDVCIINRYGESSKLGLHQDKSEPPETRLSGSAICSISVGDEADFLIGGFERDDERRLLVLRSGDGFVFGGLSRMRFHGIKKVRPNTGPREIGSPGRYNLTFRQYWMSDHERQARLL